MSLTVSEHVKGIFQRIRYGKMLDEVQSLRSEVRTYAQDLFTGKAFYPFTSDGYTINRETAMRVATWFTCMQVRWDGMGTLPANVFVREGKSKSIAVDDPRQYLVHTRPNPLMTATQFWKSVQQKCDNSGNAFAPILRNPQGMPYRINLISESSDVQVYFADEPYYRYKGQDIASSDMLHFKGLTFDGKMGVSLTEWHAGTIGSLKQINNYSNRSVSTNPGIYATTDKDTPMGDKTKGAFKDYWEKEMAGMSNGEIPVLYNGYKLDTVGINPKDAMYLDQIRAKKEDIYGITRVPPKLAQDYNASSGLNYNNPEQQGVDFLTWTLGPMIKDKEDELNYKLFSSEERSRMFTKFNEKALLRTDAKTQAEYLEKLSKMGYTINEIRDILDMNPVDGGDDPLVDGTNLKPLRLLEQLALMQSKGKSDPTTTA